MKTTTSLMEYLQSELINAGHNEFFNDNQLTFFDDKYAFIYKVMAYDEDVAEIVNRRIFHGFTLSDPEADKVFKRGFVTRFLDREFSRQTVEAFASKVINTSIVLRDYMDIAFEHAKDFMINGTDNTTTQDSTDIKDHRYLNSNLPQDMFNMNVNDDIMKTANENTISKDKDKYDSTTKANGKNYDINKFNETFYMIERIYQEFDKKCFLHIW